MVKIDSCWEDDRNLLLDQAAPILTDLKEVLGGFADPELGYIGTKSIYLRLSAMGLVLEQWVIEKLLKAASNNGAVLSIDTRQGPLVATIMKANV